MRADRIDLQGLFSADVTFVAPLFQRPYVWEQERNWEPLWAAARGVADQHAAGGTGVRPHFLGAVVLNQRPTPTGGIPVRELIDGQQRLTTLQLLLAASRDLAAQRGFDRLSKAFAKLVENDAPLATAVQDDFKVWPTNADRPAYLGALRPGADGAVVSTGSKILAAYAYFAGVIGEWVGEEDAEIRLRAFYDAVTKSLHLVAIDLDEKDGDDPQLIFETLNALGTPLLPADLVKNFLFQRTAHQEANAVRLYNLYWRDFDEDQDYWRQEIAQGRLYRPRIDHFLQHYLTLHTGAEVPATRLFQAFKEYDAKAGLSVGQHLEQFQAYSAVYRQFALFPRDTREGDFFYRLDVLDTTTVYPLLLEVFFRLNGPEGEMERRQVLDDLESFLVRREVCRLTPKNYNRVFLDALEHVRSDFSARTLEAFLMGREGDSARWPDDAEFHTAWTRHPLYRLLVRRRLRMVLEAVEMASRTDKSEAVLLPTDLTVEHVLPQQWHLHWPLPRPAEGDGRDKQARADDRDVALHTVGNLTLVTGKLNPSLSNGPWTRKRSALRKHSALTLNRDLAEHDTWGEEDIKRRAEVLFGVARTVWSFPERSSPTLLASEP